MSEIINWSNATNGSWYPDSKHQESQQEFIGSLEKAVFNMLNKRANDFKKIFETRLSKETMSQLENLGAFNPENLALAKNYTVIGSDFHGDLFSLYGFLVLCGYLIPDSNRTLLMNFETGEVLIDSNDPAKQKSIQDLLKQYNKENKKDVLVLLQDFK